MNEKNPISTLLQPFELKNGRSLPERILPGPMDGITEGSFLMAMSRRHWTSSWFTPFLRISTGVPRHSRLAEWLRPYQATGLPVIAQLMGVSTARLAAAAARLQSLGAICVDLNCACPSRAVVDNGSGGACLRSPDWIYATLQAMRDACPNGAISVKLRFGFSSPSEFTSIAAAIRAAAPDLVTIHFRTVAEQYRPVAAGLERMRLARELLPESFLIGCGDLFDIESAIFLRQELAYDGVMPARGLLANPALLLDIRHHCQGLAPQALTLSEKLGFLLDLAADSSSKSGRSNGFVLRMARSLFGIESEYFQQLLVRRSLSRSRLYLEQCQQKAAFPAT